MEQISIPNYKYHFYIDSISQIKLRNLGKTRLFQYLPHESTDVSPVCC